MNRPISVDWKPFQIDPDTDARGETVEAYCRRRWGGSGWTGHLIEEGRKDGAMFRNWEWWPNTLKAHQLVLFAGRRGVSSNLCNAALFQAEYEDGKNISLVDVLVRIAKEDLGLSRSDEDILRVFLDSDEGAAEVRTEIRRGRREHDISGVPFFVVDYDENAKPCTFSGAQSHERLVGLFNHLSGGR